MDTIVDSIIETFKFDHMMKIEAKINFTAMIFTQRDLIAESEDFYEEECHLSLVNWIYEYINESKRYNELLDEKVFHLIYNILIIFEILPLKVNDLFELKIFEKLNKLRKFIKTKNINIYSQVDRLLNYWTSFCTNNLLNVKRNRTETEFQDDKSVKKLKIEEKDLNCQSCKIETTKNNKLNGILKYSDIKKQKKLKWNSILNNTIIYEPNKSPADFGNEIESNIIHDRFVMKDENYQNNSHNNQSNNCHLLDNTKVDDNDLNIPVKIN